MKCHFGIKNPEWVENMYVTYTTVFCSTNVSAGTLIFNHKNRKYDRTTANWQYTNLMVYRCFLFVECLKWTIQIQYNPIICDWLRKLHRLSQDNCNLNNNDKGYLLLYYYIFHWLPTSASPDPSSTIFCWAAISGLACIDVASNFICSTLATEKNLNASRTFWIYLYTRYHFLLNN